MFNNFCNFTLNKICLKKMCSNQLYEELETFVCLYFENDNSFTVVPKSTISKIDKSKNTCQIYYHDKKKYYTAEIWAEGSLKYCEKKCEKFIDKRTNYVSSTEDDDFYSTQKEQNNLKRKKKSSDELFDNQLKRFKELIDSPKPNDSSSNDSSVEKQVKSKSSISIEKIDKLDKLDAKVDQNFSLLLSKIMETNQMVKDFIDQQKDKCNKESSSNTKKEVFYGNKNLLGFNASSTTKYITGLMEILFTKEELAKGYIIEGKSRSKREPLDLERLELLKNAFFIKYNIPEDKEDETYKFIKLKANRKCLDSC